MPVTATGTTQANTANAAAPQRPTQVRSPGSASTASAARRRSQRIETGGRTALGRRGASQEVSNNTAPRPAPSAPVRAEVKTAQLGRALGPALARPERADVRDVM